MKTAEQTADSMARKCALAYWKPESTSNTFTDAAITVLANTIKQSIPLVQLLECVEALKRLWDEDEMGFITFSHEQGTCCGQCRGKGETKLTIVHDDGCVQGYIYAALTNLDRAMKGEKV